MAYLPHPLPQCPRSGLPSHRSAERDRTLYYREGVGYTLDQLYQAHKHRLVKAAALELSLIRVPVRCGNGLKGASVFTKGYKEPDLEARPDGKIKAEPP